MNAPERWFPILIVGAAAVYLIGASLPPQDPTGAMQVTEVGKLPVLDGGRVKPLDTLARNFLLTISNRTTFVDVDGETKPPVKWLLDVAMAGHSKNSPAFEQNIFRIENDQVLNLLGLPMRPGSYRYSYNELGPKLTVLEKEGKRVSEIDPKERDLFDQKVLELAHHVSLWQGLSMMKDLRVIPPRKGEEEWDSLQDAFLTGEQTGIPNATARSFVEILDAYGSQDVERFNREVENYQAQLSKRVPADMAKVELEYHFNHWAPFYHCSILYVLVFVLASMSWLFWTVPLNRAALWLTVVLLAVHSGALLSRMYIQGRPPVTNLYSSAVFIGWGAVILGLVMEAIYRNGIGSALAAVVGSGTLLIAHHLANSGDTMEMMQAVLDTNFWLATHVTCVTLGYTATFVAGFLGCCYILCGVLTRALNRDLVKTLGQMLYGVVCFATFLSFTGTVLGGIWADQSWGRFWGWDPKENGAVLIVIWNALLLHARWGGLVKQRGMALLAVVGNMVTGWSWFGTNQLGVGLHAYGFNNTLAMGLTAFWGLMLVIIVMGVMPLRKWRSYTVLNMPASSLATAPRNLTPTLSSPAARKTLRQKSTSIRAGRSR
jgi:ABC-type transport system involved in cytochrome c biogenesis permease subunit